MRFSVVHHVPSFWSVSITVLLLTRTVCVLTTTGSWDVCPVDPGRHQWLFTHKRSQQCSPNVSHPETQATALSYARTQIFNKIKTIIYNASWKKLSFSRYYFFIFSKIAVNPDLCVFVPQASSHCSKERSGDCSAGVTEQRSGRHGCRWRRWGRSFRLLFLNIKQGCTVFVTGTNERISSTVYKCIDCLMLRYL